MTPSDGSRIPNHPPAELIEYNSARTMFFSEMTFSKTLSFRSLHFEAQPRICAFHAVGPCSIGTNQGKVETDDPRGYLALPYLFEFV